MSTEGPPGTTRRVIAEGYIPGESRGPDPQMTSHETACMLNAADPDAHSRITLYFSDRDPGPYEVIARHTAPGTCASTSSTSPNRFHMTPAAPR